MAKLTSAERKKLPASKFALRSERKYPVDTRGRAANAKARAAQAVNAGRMSPSTKAKIVAKANAILEHGGNALSAAAKAMKRKKA